MIRPTQEKVRQALFSALGEKIEGCRFLDLFAGTGAVGLEAWSRGASSVCWVEIDARVFSVLRRNVLHLCVSQGDANGNEAGASSIKTRTVRADAVKFLSKTGRESALYDVIFADPPYDTRGGAARLHQETHSYGRDPDFAFRPSPGMRGGPSSGGCFGRDAGPGVRDSVRQPVLDAAGGGHAWLRKTLQALEAGPILAADGILIVEQSVEEPFLDCQGWSVIRDKTYGGTRLRFLRK